MARTVSVRLGFDTSTPAFVFRVTKASAANTGIGLLRPLQGTLSFGQKPPGDPGASWAGDLLTITQSLFDWNVNGRVKHGANNLVTENCYVKGDPVRQVPSSAQQMVDGGGFTGGVVRYCKIRPSYVSYGINSTGRRNLIVERNDMSGHTDGFSPSLGSSNDVSSIVRGNYIHDPAFYTPDPGHDPTPTTRLDGTSLDPASPYWNAAHDDGVAWNHSDGMQVEAPAITGIEFYGNTVIALWDPSPTVSKPLPRNNLGGIFYKELSCLMLNGGQNLAIEDNWFDGGEYCVNNAGATVSGHVWRNRFGRNMLRRSSDNKYAALMVTSASLDTGNGTSNRNIWEDNGLEVGRSWSA